MEERLQKNCEKLLEYRKAIKRKMFWRTAPNEEAIMCSLMLMAEGKEMDVDAYVKCRKLLRANVNMFNEFRGIGEVMVITKMMMADDPVEYIKGAMKVYKNLRNRHKLTASPYMVMAAINVYEKAGAENCDPYLDQLDELYKQLKNDHPWLVWDSDRGFLSMLVCIGATGQAVVEDIDACYQSLKDITIMRDSVHSLAQILSISGMSTEDKTNLYRDLYEEMAARGRKISKSYGMSALGALTILKMPKTEIVDRICDADDFLKGKWGFILNGSRMRRLYASLLVLITYANEDSTSLVNNITGTVTMDIVIQIIIMIIIMINTSTTVAISSSSSN